MTQPIDVDLPHNLGKDEARRRIANNIHKLQEHIPGGAQVQSAGPATSSTSTSRPWARRSTATIDVEETKVHLKVLLPGMLGMFAGVDPGGAAEEGQRPARGSQQGLMRALRAAIQRR